MSFIRTQVGNGVGEIIPDQQARVMAAALEAAGVPTQLEVVPLAKHAAELLTPEVWSGIDAFLTSHLSG